MEFMRNPEVYAFFFFYTPTPTLLNPVFFLFSRMLECYTHKTTVSILLKCKIKADHGTVPSFCLEIAHLGQGWSLYKVLILGELEFKIVASGL